MAAIEAMLQDHFDLLLVAVFLWSAAWVGASVIHRRSKGRPIWPEPPANSVFVEKWTSGRSLRSLRTKLGGARNCLFVAVTSDALIIQPHFPFTLGFLPEVYGLDWVIPRSKIKRISTQRGLLRESVVVEFSLPQAQSESVELMLRDPAEFKAALGQ